MNDVSTNLFIKPNYYNRPHTFFYHYFIIEYVFLAYQNRIYNFKRLLQYVLLVIPFCSFINSK